MEAIARNHPFLQGNKRTGFQVMLLFWVSNGLAFEHPDTDDFAVLPIELLQAGGPEARATCFDALVAAGRAHLT